MFANRLKEERNRIGLSQTDFGEMCGVTKQAQIRYEKGERKPDSSYLEKAYELGVDVNYLLTGTRFLKDDAGTNEEYCYVPFYESIEVSAGFGLDGIEGVTATVPFRKEWLRQRNLYEKDLHIVTARGDSMEPTISNKETLLVNTAQNIPRDGNIYVIRQGDTLWVKRIQLQLGGTLSLISDNSTYPIMTLDLTKNEDVEIIGRVVNVSKDV